jgi:CRISPR-associated protein Cmr4
MNSTLIVLHALSPLHMGTGAAIGAIDLPHAREAATKFPYAPGSGLKGVLRDEFDALAPPLAAPVSVKHLFGAEQDQNLRDQGALLFSDASLLALPVRSWVGTFAWVTCPSLLRRLSRELVELGQAPLTFPTPANANVAHAATPNQISNHGNAVLHDIQLTVPPDPGVGQVTLNTLAALAFGDADWQVEFKQRLLVVHDDVMRYFSDNALDVRPRIRLLAGKQVKDGSLWNEENLPTETLLWATVAAEPIREVTAAAALNAFVTNACNLGRLQVGGKATVGRGIVRLTLPLPLPDPAELVAEEQEA